MTTNSYPDLAKSERKDSLVPDPQEFDFSDPDAKAVHEACQTAKGRLEVFERLTIGEWERDRRTTGALPAAWSIQAPD